MAVVGVLYVVDDGDDPNAEDTEILLTTEDEPEARMHARRHRAVVYRYDVADDEDFTNEQLVYSGQ